MSRTPALLLLFALSLSISAQSFDCKLAQSSREITVCSNTRLSALDAELAASYKSLRARLSPQSAALVQSDQNEWLRWIDFVCPYSTTGNPDDHIRCLQNQYFTRVHDLQQTAPLGGALLFPRIDSQPDQPNAAQTAWNNAIKSRAATRAVNFNWEKRPDDSTATF